MSVPVCTDPSKPYPIFSLDSAGNPAPTCGPLPSGDSVALVTNVDNVKLSSYQADPIAAAALVPLNDVAYASSVPVTVTDPSYPTAIKGVADTATASYFSADFTSGAVTLQPTSSFIYAIDTSSTVPVDAGTFQAGGTSLIVTNTPLGYTVEPNTLVGTPVTVPNPNNLPLNEENCAQLCTSSSSTCDGFNLTSPTTCTFLSGSSVDQVQANDTVSVGFMKNAFNSLYPNSGYKSAVNLNSDATHCSNVTACNADLQLLLTNGLSNFSTRDIQSCYMCPERRYTGSQVITNGGAIAVSSSTTALPLLQYSTGTVAQHTISITTTSVITFTLLTYNAGLAGSSWQAVVVPTTTTGFVSMYTVTNKTLTPFTGTTNSSANAVEILLYPVEFVENGYIIRTSSGLVYSQIGTQCIGLPSNIDLISAGCVFTLTMSTMANFIGGLIPSPSYATIPNPTMSSPLTAYDSSAIQILSYMATYSTNQIYCDSKGTYWYVDGSSGTFRQFADVTMLSWYQGLLGFSFPVINTPYLDPLFAGSFGTPLPDPYAAYRQYRTFVTQPNEPSAQNWVNSQSKSGCDRAGSCGGQFAEYHCTASGGGNCDETLPVYVEMVDPLDVFGACDGTYVVCLPTDQPTLIQNFSVPLPAGTTLNAFHVDVVDGYRGKTGSGLELYAHGDHTTYDLKVQTFYTTSTIQNYDVSWISKFLAYFPIWTIPRLVPTYIAGSASCPTAQYRGYDNTCHPCPQNCGGTLGGSGACIPCGAGQISGIGLACIPDTVSNRALIGFTAYTSSACTWGAMCPVGTGSTYMCSGDYDCPTGSGQSCQATWPKDGSRCCMDSAMFTSVGYHPAAPVTGVNVTNVGFTNATVSWSGGGQGASYFVISLKPIGNSSGGTLQARSSGIVIVTTSGGYHIVQNQGYIYPPTSTYVFNGISAGVQWSVTVQSFTDHGVGDGISVPVIFSTLPPVNIQYPKVTGVTQTSISVSWYGIFWDSYNIGGSWSSGTLATQNVFPPPLPEQLQIMSTFIGVPNLAYIGTNQSTRGPSTPSPINTFTFSGLQPGVLYTLWIAGINISGEQAHHLFGSAQTLGGNPLPVTNGEVFAVTDTSATVTWSNEFYGTTTYTVNIVSSTGALLTQTVSQPPVQFTGLTSFTQYTATVVSVGLTNATYTIGQFITGIPGGSGAGVSGPTSTASSLIVRPGSVAAPSAMALIPTLSPIPGVFAANLVSTPKATNTTIEVDWPNIDSLGGEITANITLRSLVPQVTGGTITTINGNEIHTFTSSGTLTTTNPLRNVQVLVVGGGGAGGTPPAIPSSGPYVGAYVGGGGGGGQVSYYPTTGTLLSGSYTVTIGPGGTGALGLPGTSGGASQITGSAGLLFYAGGGAGGSSTTAASVNDTGSTGGGSDYVKTPVPVKGTWGAYVGGSGATSAAGGGGGGGAPGTTSNGGIGFASSISGTNTTYGGGGGGGNATTSSSALGGQGGGGQGSIAYHVNNSLSTAGTNGLGGGGGGSCWTGVANIPVTPGSSGGSGIVIVSFPVPSTQVTTIQQTSYIGSFIASGLLPNTGYSVSIDFYDSNGTYLTTVTQNKTTYGPVQQISLQTISYSSSDTTVTLSSTDYQTQLYAQGYVYTLQQGSFDANNNFTPASSAPIISSGFLNIYTFAGTYTFNNLSYSTTYQASLYPIGFDGIYGPVTTIQVQTDLHAYAATGLTTPYVGSTVIFLKWTAGQNASLYLVLLNGKLTTQTSGTSLFISVTAATTYVITLQSVTKNGSLCDTSTPITVSTSLTVPAPTGLRVNSTTSSSVNVYYDYYSGLAYNVAITPGTSTSTVAAPPVTFGIATGTMYTVSCSISEKAGLTGPAATVTFIPGPTITSTLAGFTTIAVTWSPVSGASSYYVSIPGSYGPYTTSSTTYTISLTATAVATYTVQIQSVKSDGSACGISSTSVTTRGFTVLPNFQCTATSVTSFGSPTGGVLFACANDSQCLGFDNSYNKLSGQITGNDLSGSRCYINPLSIGPVANISFTNIGFNSVTINWTINGLNATSYQISFPNGTTQTASSSPYTITGLTPGTNYSFTVTSLNAQGVVGASTTTSYVSTLYLAAFSSVTFSSVGATSAVMSWTGGGNPASIIAIIGIQGVAGSSGTTVISPATSPYTFNGLTAATGYTILLRPCYDTAGTNCSGSYDYTVLFRTLGLTPLTNLSISSVTSRSVVLTWTGASNPYYSITTVPSAMSSGTQPIVTTSGSPYALQNLAINQSYTQVNVVPCFTSASTSCDSTKGVTSTTSFKTLQNYVLNPSFTNNSSTGRIWYIPANMGNYTWGTTPYPAIMTSSDGYTCVGFASTSQTIEQAIVVSAFPSTCTFSFSAKFSSSGGGSFNAVCSYYNSSGTLITSTTASKVSATATGWATYGGSTGVDVSSTSRIVIDFTASCYSCSGWGTYITSVSLG